MSDISSNKATIEFVDLRNNNVISDEIRKGSKVIKFDFKIISYDIYPAKTALELFKNDFTNEISLPSFPGGLLRAVKMDSGEHLAYLQDEKPTYSYITALLAANPPKSLD
ncbi:MULTISPECIES: hypothetical protein [unclassified Tatumella]|uniref:hypothetical protein n=1 Tax=unclassified Tatumella TaxID=2649542 RepID=UPI001BAE5E5D|nr:MULTISPECIES: hypothetical protein [unclassified Tatumella]MBS0878463.1 hypothetical protein [Tatumella sp. JGM82]MBS0892039.1 hypothetical protein [Tatumella sp. JGM94]MBS0903157.1 hypothetical protein [Tatumella sp. JGM100]